jgi:hypothetical protein
MRALSDCSAIAAATSASLVGPRGQAPIVDAGQSLTRVTLLFAVWMAHCLRAAARMCRIGVESLAFGRARGAADIFGFIHPIVRVRTIPAGSAELSSDHAAASLAPSRNSLPSTHMRCRTTANLRATATKARRRPLVFISRTPQAFKLDHVIERISMAFAAA